MAEAGKMSDLNARTETSLVVAGRSRNHNTDNDADCRVWIARRISSGSRAHQRARRYKCAANDARTYGNAGTYGHASTFLFKRVHW